MIHCITALISHIPTLIPCIPTLIPHIPTLIPQTSYPDSHIPTPIPCIPTLIPRVPTLIPCIPFISLIPFPYSPFQFLQMAWNRWAPKEKCQKVAIPKWGKSIIRTNFNL